MTEKEVWWNTVEKYWEHLFAIIIKFLPNVTFIGCEGNIISHDTLMEITLLKECKDPRLCRYLFMVWDAALDDPSIHSISGWRILCDLLSEEYIFNEGEDNGNLGKDD
jgi:hypothetical protein